MPGGGAGVGARRRWGLGAGGVGAARLSARARAQPGGRGGGQVGGLLAGGGRPLGGAGQDVVAGHHRVVDALDRVDGRPAATRVRRVEDVVVDERPDLDELDRGGGVDRVLGPLASAREGLLFLRALAGVLGLV